MRKLRIPFEEFAARVEKAYDGRISIVEETYTGTRNKVTAYCNVHKIYFEVNVARDLCRGNVNCPECIKLKRRQKNKSQKITFDEMLKRFREAYGDKFSYDKSSYHGRKELMKVHCNDCGTDFEITPIHHLKYNNGGCPECSKYKIVKCSNCGKDIIVDRHVGPSFKVYCDECRSKMNLLYGKKYKIKKNNTSIESAKKNKKLKHLTNKNTVIYCKICGRPLNDNLKCDNEFCNTHYYQTLMVLVKRFGFDESKIGTIEVEEEFNRIRNILYDMYWNQHMSSTEICNIFGYKSVHGLVDRLFKYLKIPPKTLSQSIKENLEMGRLKLQYDTVHFKQYHYITWENKEVMFRSSYELDYAKELDIKRIKYDIENLKIKYYDTQENKERLAIPDFYLIDTNTIVEIKSTWTLDVINMIDKVKAYKENGYDFKLILEHKETDLYSLTNEPKFKCKSIQHFSLKKKSKTKVGHNKWRWMNNGTENFKVPENDINEYLEKNFVFGHLSKIKHDI